MEHRTTIEYRGIGAIADEEQIEEDSDGRRLERALGMECNHGNR